MDVKSVSERMLTVATGALLVLGVLAPAGAQQAPPGGQPERPVVEKAAPAKPAVQPQRLIGSVKSAAAGSLVLEVTQKDKSTKEYTFALDPKAKLSKAGKAIAAEDLQPGDSATVSFTEADGKLIAKAVRAKTGK